MSRKGISVHYLGIIAILGVALSALVGGMQPPTAQATTDLVLYTDSLASGWQNEVSNTTAAFNNSNPVYAGSASLAVTHTGSGGLYLKTNSPLAWNAYEVIRFQINGGTTGGQKVRLRVVGHKPWNNPYESIGFVLPALQASTWTPYEINLAELGTTHYNIISLKFENAITDTVEHSIPQPTYYLDNIEFGFATQQPAPAPTGSLTLSINTSADRYAISPYIYGSNMDFRDVDRLPARRLSGNRLTGYNWENNASNGGRDTGSHNSDAFMCWSQELAYPGCEGMPGAAITNFHNQSIAQDAYSLVTAQMAGYVAKDMSGPVDLSEAAPSSRWVPVVPAKGAPFSTSPNLNDNAVYMDEFVNFLVQEYGNATNPLGVRGYSLDNEPALWPSTHPRIWPSVDPNPNNPDHLTYTELVSKSIALAQAIKAVDPNAEIFGPAAYGFEEFRTLQGAPDRTTEQTSGQNWFIDYYLDRLRTAAAPGQRLLDVLDVHWYPEAKGGNQRIVMGTVRKGDNAVQQARMQAPRTLWDPTYQEDSWIASNFASYLPLIPELQASIDAHYPGTKLAFTEFDYGGDYHISGGIASADVLGIFGRYKVYMGHFWNEDANYDPIYTAAAYRLYRNYDGNHNTFEDTHVRATTSDIAKSSVYASVNADNSQMHIILLNKSTETLTSTFNIASNKQYASGAVWGFNQYTSRIFQAAPISGISGNSFQYTLPPLTAYHIVLQTDPPAATRTPTNTRTPTITRTPTNTRTPTATLSPTITPTPTMTPTSEPTTCAVTYTNVNQWDVAFEGAVTITNTGTGHITGWTLEWNYANGQSISGIWNATRTQTGGAVTAYNANWNGTINPGGTASFGFLATHNGTNSIPTSFTLNGISCTISS